MRKLMLFTIGFAIGCVLGIWITYFWLVILFAILFATCFGFLYYFHPNFSRKIVAVILLGTALGICWMLAYDRLYVDEVRDLDGETKSLSIEVTDFLASSSYGYGTTGKVKLNGKTYKVQFNLNNYVELFPGDVISGSFYLRFTGYGGDDSPTHHQGKGIFLLAYASDTVEHIAVEKIPPKYFATLVRRRIINQLVRIFPEDQAGFALSLLLGDTSKLSLKDDAALKISGIRHVVAVSGLHVSILLSFAYMFSRGNRYLLAGIGLPLLVLFAAIAGFTPSIIRACVMQGIMLLGILFDTEYDAPTALSLAALMIIGANPFAITSVSFQLSVGCVIGIMLFGRKIHDVLLRTKLGPAKGRSLKSKIIRGLVSSVSVTLSTIAVTLPISAYYFGSISLVSIITNMLTLWLITICFYGVVISCLVSFVFPSVGAAIAGVISWPMRIVLKCAGMLSDVPFAIVSIHNPFVLTWVVFAYILFLVFMFSKKRRPFLFVSMAAASLVCTLIFCYTEPRMDNYRMTVLDVGQGQCIILQSKDSCFVVDCGGDYSSGAADLAAQTLRSCGIQQIDGLILTHFDADHSGGAEFLLAQMDVVQIYAPDEDRSDVNYVYRKVRKEMVLDCGDATISVLPGEKGKTGNESSLCILFQAKNCDILITGDRNSSGERYLIDHYDIPKLEVLVAGHHGSDSSTSLYLLQKTRPAAVVISVGENNRYMHPSEDVLRRLERFDSIVWRTDEDGTIIIRG